MRPIIKLIERIPNIIIAVVILILLFGNVGQTVWRFIVGGEEEARVNSLVSMVQNVNTENYRLRMQSEAQQAAQIAGQYQERLKMRRFIEETYKEPPEVLAEAKRPMKQSMAVRLKKIMGE